MTPAEMDLEAERDRLHQQYLDCREEALARMGGNRGNDEALLNDMVRAKLDHYQLGTEGQKDDEELSPGDQVLYAGQVYEFVRWPRHAHALLRLPNSTHPDDEFLIPKYRIEKLP